VFFLQVLRHGDTARSDSVFSFPGALPCFLPGNSFFMVPSVLHLRTPLLGECSSLFPLFSRPPKRPSPPPLRPPVLCPAQVEGCFFFRKTPTPLCGKFSSDPPTPRRFHVAVFPFFPNSSPAPEIPSYAFLSRDLGASVRFFPRLPFDFLRKRLSRPPPPRLPSTSKAKALYLACYRNPAQRKGRYPNETGRGL